MALLMIKEKKTKIALKSTVLKRKKSRLYLKINFVYNFLKWLFASSYNHAALCTALDCCLSIEMFGCRKRSKMFSNFRIYYVLVCFRRLVI